MYRAVMFPSAPGRTFAASYGKTNCLSESYVRYPTRCGTARPVSVVTEAGRAVPLEFFGQNFGSGVWEAASSAASSSVSTDGGEPARGFWAVSFMQATAITPTRAAAIA